MEKIPSFKIDHTKLKKGVYVSRKDTTPSGDTLTTFDIRMAEPNVEQALNPRTLHTIEHLAATWLRNHPVWKDRIVYWGPMGCCTGNYLIVQGDIVAGDILELIKDMFMWISNYEGDIPGATPKDCGNYTFNDPVDAKLQAKKYLEEVLSDLNMPTQYPD